MKTPSFVHLNLHTDYSLKDGLCHLDALFDLCDEMGIPALALTDLNNLFAAIKFYTKALKKGIKPIIGCDIECYDAITDENKKTKLNPSKQAYHLTLLCQNNVGYRNLIQVVSSAYNRGQVILDKPGIARDWLKAHQEGLIALSGGIDGDVGQCILKKDRSAAKECILYWRSIFGDRYYLEVHKIGSADEEYYLKEVVQLAAELQVPLVATNKVRFLTAAQYEAHEARVCISEGSLLGDSNRTRRYTPQQYLRSDEEMQKLFAEFPSALNNSVEIAKRCNLHIVLGEYHLPHYPVPEGFSTESYLEHMAKTGLADRWAAITAFNENVLPRLDYDERLERELAVINGMGYTGYFLIVADFINWAKNNDVPVGPGRGSGPGSLVAYCIGITDLDPLKYDLLFERFLNPERVSMPDFDVDFCMEGRDKVIDYVASRYGRHSVSQIITYGTMAAKAVVRDVGRVLGYPYGFVDTIAKLIPFELGITLEKALAQEEILRQRYEEEEDVRALIELALILEGSVRNAGKHAGGVVIAPSQISDFAPIYCEAGSDAWVTQYDKDDVEAVGLVKYDFLGLRTLTIIKWAVEAIHAQQRKKQETLLDIALIDLNDPVTFDLLQKCQTTAVFQLESRGMKDIVKRLKPDCFEDIIALVALFRPGPLQSGMVEDFINRKQGIAEVAYQHPDLLPVLKHTYGIILYQEQVMQIAQVLANYTLGGADLLRRAMGKKKPEEMAKQRQIFINGAKQRDIDEKLANAIFDLMEKFAGYGFNKSHSAAYALLAYQTAWLKAHYPAEFMAAVLTSELQDTDKLAGLIDECRQMGLSIIPPSIYSSVYAFKVNEDHAIEYGLGALKGVGEGAIEAILLARKEHGHFSSFYDFIASVDLKKVNKRVFETLINSGACDVFVEEIPGVGPGPMSGVRPGSILNVGAGSRACPVRVAHRSILLASLPTALSLAEKKSLENSRKQGSLFALLDDKPETAYVMAPAWNLRQRLQAEKNSFGFYFSGLPISAYRAELDYVFKTRIADLSSGDYQKVAGWVLDVRVLMTKKEERMAIIKLVDETGQMDITVFPDLYQELRSIIQKDCLLVIEGDTNIDEWNGTLRMSARKLWGLEDFRQIHVKHIELALQDADCSAQKLQAIQTILAKHNQGSTAARISFSTFNATAQLALGESFQVNPSDALLDELGQHVAVKLVY
ncbi:MAG: polymerase alpha subunit [Gammaproteobacteria bacterium]|jgi:DNA polymerase-3 subunit alpha|nr:polymerase alpha subunit [Gammaproteobacteria bacterium]